MVKLEGNGISIGSFWQNFKFKFLFFLKIASKGCFSKHGNKCRCNERVLEAKEEEIGGRFSLNDTAGNFFCGHRI